MKTKLKGLSALFLALLLVGALALPALAATTAAYPVYYVGDGEVGEEINLNDPSLVTLPSFEFGDGAATVDAQLNAPSAPARIGWKLWGAYSSGDVARPLGDFVTKPIGTALTEEEYEAITSEWDKDLIIRSLSLKLDLGNLTCATEAAGAGEFLALALTPDNGYVLPTTVLVYSGNELLEKGVDYTYADGKVTVLAHAVTDDVTLVASALRKIKEFRLGGEDNATLQWRYEGDTVWTDISTVAIGELELTVADLEARLALLESNGGGSVDLSGIETDITTLKELIEACKAADRAINAELESLTERVVALEKLIAEDTDLDPAELVALAEALAAAKEEITALKLSVGKNATDITDLNAKLAALELAYKAADKALGDAVSALGERVEALEVKAEDDVALIVIGVLSGVALAGNIGTVTFLVIQYKKKKKTEL